MTHQSAAAHEPPGPESQVQPVAEPASERDTLNDTPELRFLRDEIEALLGAASVRRIPHDPQIAYADAENADELDRSTPERDTEPNIDEELVAEIERKVAK